MADVRLSESWFRLLEPEFESDYMRSLKAFLQAEKQAGQSIYPKGSEYFAALDAVPFETARVVILGQDPYHGPGQAHGLSFSVRPEVPVPPSLGNIYKEIQQDLGLSPSDFVTGDLSGWAKQGVLLLNSVLTVRQGAAASHRGKGWEPFTDRIIALLGARELPLVYMLWGSFAQSKAALIEGRQHLVLKAPHPSPLSAHRGFFGCRHFSQCNEFLSRYSVPIDWRVGLTQRVG